MWRCVRNVGRLWIGWGERAVSSQQSANQQSVKHSSTQQSTAVSSQQKISGPASSGLSLPRRASVMCLVPVQCEGVSVNVGVYVYVCASYKQQVRWTMLNLHTTLRKVQTNTTQTNTTSTHTNMMNRVAGSRPRERVGCMPA